MASANDITETILIVDDEEPVRRTFHEWLEGAGFGCRILSAGDAETADFTARALSRAAPQLPGVTVLGPAPAPLAVLRSRHRRRFLIKAGREVRLQAVLRDWLSRVRTAGSARIQIDIDPYSFL